MEEQATEVSLLKRGTNWNVVSLIIRDPLVSFISYSSTTRRNRKGDTVRVNETKFGTYLFGLGLKADTSSISVSPHQVSPNV